MNKRICVVFMLSLLVSASPFCQMADLTTHHEVKDSIVARFNRNDFSAIYRLADTSYHTSERDLTRFLTNNKRSYGPMIRSTFLTDSACSGCDTKRAIYYMVEFHLRTLVMVLEVTPQKKISSFGLLNYSYPDRTAVNAIKTNNPILTSLDRSVDSAARDYFRNPNVVGLSIGIIKNGKRFIYQYGETTKGIGKLPTGKTFYELGSIGKTFTSTVLANAVLEKRVELNDDIRKYLPEPYPDLEYNSKAITLQHLATHTSGIPSLPDNFYTNPLHDPLKPWNDYTFTMFGQFLQRVKLDTVPGYKERYSNSAVALLGHILANVYGQPFDRLLEKYVFQPFKMINTSTKLSKAGAKNAASKYSTNGWIVPYWSSPAYTSAGVGIVTCLDDMLNYVDGQIAEADPAVRLTHQPTVNNSGLGWGIGNVGTQYRKYEHSGGTNGFSTNVRVFPEIKAGMVILANNDVNLATLIRRLSPLIMQ